MSVANGTIRWRRGSVRVEDGAGGFAEPAVVCRGLAVHALPSRGVHRYRVTHVASVKLIRPVWPTRAGAFAWARRLLDLGDWTGSAKVVLRRFEPRVVRMLAAMRDGTMELTTPVTTRKARV